LFRPRITNKLEGDLLMEEQAKLIPEGKKAPMKGKPGRPVGFKPSPKVAQVEHKAEPKTPSKPLDVLDELELKPTIVKEEVDKFKEQREKDAEIVNGIFHWHEVKGGKFEFMFRKYKGDPIKKYELMDGERYPLPRAVARHLNTNGWTPIYSYKEDEKGRPVATMTGKEQRFSFQSLDFIDDTVMENRAKKIVIVDKI
jgi:hypothetical protein